MNNKRGRMGNSKHPPQNNEKNRIYAHPLPLIIEPTESSNLALKSSSCILGIFGYSSRRITRPHLEGVFDTASRSVWLPVNEESMMLWKQGFFGKGNLSRSEPSWLAREVNQRQARAAGKLTAEEMREKRRAERKQFKLDRARAMAEASMEAEKAFAMSGVVLKESGVAIPSAATWKSEQTAGPSGAQSSTDSSEFKSAQTKSAQDDSEETINFEEQIVDCEHLQLTLQEAFFLIWTIGCLSVRAPSSDDFLALHRIWTLFQAMYYPTFLLTPSVDVHLDRFDNPFLIHYVAFHHYRSLGWIVKGGIKFCVDYMLYKRGPVFSHAEFSVVICPVYEDPEDRKSSPFNLQNVDPFSWSWLSTVNRVNSQVQKTLVLAYVTIPAMTRLPRSALESPACLSHYHVREVVVRRFIPARMRD